MRVWPKRSPFYKIKKHFTNKAVPRFKDWLDGNRDAIVSMARGAVRYLDIADAVDTFCVKLVMRILGVDERAARSKIGQYYPDLYSDILAAVNDSVDIERAVDKIIKWMKDVLDREF